MNSETFSESNNIINALKSLLNNQHSNKLVANIPTRNQLLTTESFDQFMKHSSMNTHAYISTDSEIYGGRENSPGDLLHQEAIKYLENNAKLSNIKARAYKSIAYHHIKETHPDANGFKRAELMLELVKSKTFVKDFANKLDEIVKIIEERDAEREKKDVPETKSRRSSRKSKKSSKKSKKTSRKSKKTSRKSRK